MIFKWLKRYTPRGLYGRAALILILPMVILLTIVSVTFIQRHYEDVTRQMVRNLAIDIQLLVAEVNDGDLDKARDLAEKLRIDIEIPATLPAERFDRAWYDLSANEVFAVAQVEFPQFVGAHLSADLRMAQFWLGQDGAFISLTVSRQRISASNPHQFLVLMVFVTILMVLVTMVFFRNQLRPIRRLARASDAFGRGQIMNYKPSGATEVRLAGNAFLDMRARIERQIDQRTLMLSGVSHDLRTPLTRMRLALEMMEDQSQADELVRDISDMERLVDEFLAFARMDSLDEPEQIDPVAFLNDFISRYPAKLGAPELAEGALGKVVTLRPMAIERAIGNLVGNAFRYGTTARIGLKDFDNSLVFIVEDDGPGIDEKDRGAAIRPFVRLEAARNQDKGPGVGLGLAIARDIARKHGGSLRLSESQELGGLRAEIVIPRSR